VASRSKRSAIHVRFGSLADIALVGVMSALPPKADIGLERRDVRFVPKADMRRRPVSQLAYADSRSRELRAVVLLVYQAASFTVLNGGVARKANRGPIRALIIETGNVRKIIVTRAS